ncbi:MAG: hypothetical protein L6R43_07455 [Planctomycetes bacterium]|nr:hypothetical protein [Planctomycetota bacterium]
MADLRLRVIVEDPDRPRTAGERVEGTVEVEALDDADCDGLHARVGWRTSGSANRAEAEGTEVLLGRGELRTGDRRSFPFSLVVPEGPPSYAGKRFSVHWTVRARASLSWAFDPKAEGPFLVAAAPAPSATLVQKKEAGGFEVGCAVAASVIAAACAGILLATGGNGFGWWILGGLAAVIAFFMVPVSMGYRRAGPVVFEAGPSPAAPGGELALRLSATPRSHLAPKSVAVTLTGKELSVHGSGKSKSTKSEVLETVKVVLEGPEEVRPGKEGVWAGMVRVPEEAAPSFEAGPHKVVWKLQAQMDIDWLPDPTWDLDLEVR